MDKFILPEIHFNKGDLQLNDYEKLTWKLKETRVVEFFPSKFFSVTLISTEIPEFENYLHELEEDFTQSKSDSQCQISKIAIDLEWEDELCLFQFCSSEKVLIVRHPNGPGNEILQKFLSTHFFFAKGASNDKKQLKLKFGEDFHQNIEDIAQTRLVPYGFSENFMQMTFQFAGKPTADFKDIRITTSNWSQKYLTMRQVLYAAFDVVSIYQCYPNFPPPKILTKPQKQHKTSNQIKGKNQNKKKQKICKKNTNSKSADSKESNNEKIKISMKANYVRSTFCYIIKNYIGSTFTYELYDLLNSIVELENINFITFYPEFEQNQNRKDICNQFQDKLYDEKYKECGNSIFNEYKSYLNEELEKKSNAKDDNYDTYMIFISLFTEVEIKKLIEIFPENSQVLKLPYVNPEESSDGDFLYISNLPKSLSEKSKLDRFLHCFEIDHRINIVENKSIQSIAIKNEDDDENLCGSSLYAKIEICCASSSYNLKCFVPFITFNGKNLKLFTFAYFLNSITASNFPPSFTEEDCRTLFSKFGRIQSIRTLIRRSEEDNNQFVITYACSNEANSSRTVFNVSKDEYDINEDIKDPCELAIKAINYSEIEGNEILVSRFAEEPHMRMLRRYELAVSLKDIYIQENHQQEICNEFINSRKLRSVFSKFGEIHQAYFDKRLLIGHVQFYKKCSAYHAFDYFNPKKEDENDKNLNTQKFDVDFDVMKKFDVFFPPEGSTIIVRDVSCSMPQEDIIRMCEMYGRVINFVVRLIIPKFRYQIVEVTYNDVSDALKAKKELDGRRIDNLPIVVSVFRGAGSEAPMWKMEQRYQWIVVDGIAIDEKEAHETFERFGKIIDYEVFGRKRKEINIEKKDETFSDKNFTFKFTFANNDENSSEKKENQKTMIMFNDPRSAEAAIDTFSAQESSNDENCEGNDPLLSKSYDIRNPTLSEFANDIRWNKNSLYTESFVPFKNSVNEAQQFAIVIDPLPKGFTEQWLRKTCAKCFYTLAITRSNIDPARGRKAVLFVEGTKMTKKIFALIRNRRCTADNDGEEAAAAMEAESSSSGEASDDDASKEASEESTEKVQNNENSDDVENNESTKNVQNADSDGSTVNSRKVQNHKHSDHAEEVHSSENSREAHSSENYGKVENSENSEEAHSSENYGKVENCENSGKAKNAEKVYNSENTREVENSGEVQSSENSGEVLSSENSGEVLSSENSGSFDILDDSGVIRPVIMSREEALQIGVVVDESGRDVVHAPISIIIDPLPDELSTAKKIRTNVLMGKEASVDILESATEKGRLMGVVLPKLREDCRVILRKFRRWRVDGMPLNVRKIVNAEEPLESAAQQPD